jgi:hypothetical protein
LFGHDLVFLGLFVGLLAAASAGPLEEIQRMQEFDAHFHAGGVLCLLVIIGLVIAAVVVTTTRRK